MKTPISRRLSLFFWNQARKILNNKTSFLAKELEDGFIRCDWVICNVDRIRANLSKSYFYAIRVFDVSFSGSKSTSTCIMKELQVAKSSSQYIFPLPSISRKYILELGYRKPTGEWRELSSIHFNLSLRKQSPNPLLEDKDWFTSDQKQRERQIHDDSYQLSLGSLVEGSEGLNRGYTSSGRGKD